MACGEAGDAGTGVRQAACQRCHLLRRQQRQLGHMADHDSSATLELLRKLAHQVDVHGIGGWANVEMDVDVDVELASELENPSDRSEERRVGKECRSRWKRDSENSKHT